MAPGRHLLQDVVGPGTLELHQTQFRLGPTVPVTGNGQQPVPGRADVFQLVALLLPIEDWDGSFGKNDAVTLPGPVGPKQGPVLQLAGRMKDPSETLLIINQVVVHEQLGSHGDLKRRFRFRRRPVPVQVQRPADPVLPEASVDSGPHPHVIGGCFQPGEIEGDRGPIPGEPDPFGGRPDAPGSSFHQIDLHGQFPDRRALLEPDLYLGGVVVDIGQAVRIRSDPGLDRKPKIVGEEDPVVTDPSSLHRQQVVAGVVGVDPPAGPQVSPDPLLRSLVAGRREGPVRAVAQKGAQIEADRNVFRSRLQKPPLGSRPACGKPHRHLQLHRFRRGVVELEPMSGLSRKIQPESGGIPFLIARLNPIASQIDGLGRIL